MVPPLLLFESLTVSCHRKFHFSLTFGYLPEVEVPVSALVTDIYATWGYNESDRPTQSLTGRTYRKFLAKISGLTKSSISSVLYISKTPIV